MTATQGFCFGGAAAGSSSASIAATSAANGVYAARTRVDRGHREDFRAPGPNPCRAMTATQGFCLVALLPRQPAIQTARCLGLARDRVGSSPTEHVKRNPLLGDPPAGQGCAFK